MTRFATVALIAATMAALAGAPAFGQSVPEGQSCGGLLCDMGVFGHKTAPAPAAPAPAARVEAVAPAPVDPEPTPRPVRRKKRVAKAAPEKASPATKAPAERAAPAVVATPARRVAPVAKVASKAATAAPKTAQKAVPTQPSASLPLNVIDPYSRAPSAVQFRPIY